MNPSSSRRFPRRPTRPPSRWSRSTATSRSGHRQYQRLSSRAAPAGAATSRCPATPTRLGAAAATSARDAPTAAICETRAAVQSELFGGGCGASPVQPPPQPSRFPQSWAPPPQPPAQPPPQPRVNRPPPPLPPPLPDPRMPPDPRVLDPRLTGQPPGAPHSPMPGAPPHLAPPAPPWQEPYRRSELATSRTAAGAPPFPHQPPAQPQPPPFAQSQPRSAEDDYARAAVPPSRGGPAQRGEPRSESRRPAGIEIGQLIENIPRTMRSGVAQIVEVRIAKADVKAIAEGMQGGGAPYKHEVLVTKVMSVRLRGPRAVSSSSLHRPKRSGSRTRSV